MDFRGSSLHTIQYLMKPREISRRMEAVSESRRGIVGEKTRIQHV